MRVESTLSAKEIELKVLACYGNFTAASTAKVLGISFVTVYNILGKNGLSELKKNAHRSDPYNRKVTLKSK